MTAALSTTPNSRSALYSDLIERIIKGEGHLFQEIVELHSTPIYRFVYRISGEVHLAEDLTQEVFLKAFKSLYQYDSQYQFSTWLYRIALNTCIDHQRKHKPLWIEMDKAEQVIATEEWIYK